jgi:sulfide dehydrogenase cytochrome subunit
MPRCSLLALLALSAGPVAAADTPPAVAAPCLACHDTDGSGVGKAFVPIIAGIPPAHIEEALYAYKDGARTCVVQPVMCEAAAVLSDDDIATLAGWYGSLPRYTHAASFMEDLAAKGKAVHEQLCARCHLEPDDPDVEYALGIPLQGQRSDYLRYALNAYLNGNRENLLPEMEEKLGQLRDGDIDALINYYVSY